MAFNSIDWTIDYALKTVTNNDSGVGTNLPSALGDYTKVGEVLDFFQWLATEFANTSQMDDPYAFLSDTPTVYKWVNGWAFGHADDYKYLRGASITSSDSNDFWSNVYTIGSQADGTLIYLVQNDTEVTPWWIASDGTSAGNIDILVKVKSGGAWIQSDNVSGVATNGGIWLYAREFGDTFDHGFADISGGRNPVGINTSQDGNNDSGELYVSVPSATNFTVGKFAKDTTTGAVGKIRKVVSNDIYLDAVRGGTITAANTLVEYDERECTTALDGTQTISSVTNVVAGYTNILTVFVQRDFTGGTVGAGPFVIGETVTQTGSGATGLFVAIVGTTIYLEEATGTFNGTGLLTGSTSSATYTPTATSVQTTANQDLNNGAGVQPYNAFIDGAGRSMKEFYEWEKYIVRYGSVTATYTVNSDDGQEYRSAGEGTYSDVKTAPFGTLAGTTFYGARGVWVQNYSVADFVLIDANDTQQAPPDYQKVTANHTDLDGSVSTDGGVTLYVAEITGDGGTIIKDQYQFLTAGSTATNLKVDSTIDINKTPQSGTVRIGDNKYPYTSFSGVDFTVTVDPTGETNLADTYVPLLDVATAGTDSESSDNIIFNASFWCRTVTRRYGTKPYTADVQFGANGITFSPILSDDPQAL